MTQPSNNTIFRHDPAHAQRMADMLKRQAMELTMEGASKQAEALQARAREWDKIAAQATQPETNMEN